VCRLYTGFAGVYRFTTNFMEPWQDGIRIAVFRTRKMARDNLVRVKGPLERGKYPNARVVKVLVAVSVVDE
jgi:hypothetical protein